jgi:hypothetical protein
MTDSEERSQSAARAGWASRKGRPAWSQAAVPLIGVMTAVVFGLSACGGGSSPGVASVGTTTTTTVTTAQGTSGSAASGSAASGSATTQQQALRYAKCMRAHGVKNFPDPDKGGGFEFNKNAVDPSSPAFEATQAKCRKLVPGGGPPAPGTRTHPSSQEMAHMLGVARCMRSHGISGFPDPTTTIPSLTHFTGVVSMIFTVIFVFPGSLDMHSPQFARAAAACGFPLHNH